MTTLTEYLCSLSTPTPYDVAVSHPFLVSVASISLPANRLALYLFQDRIYAAQAYPRFIAQLITKIPLDDTLHAPLVTRTLTLLVGCLTNIVREVAFFDSTARAYDLLLDHDYWLERKATRDYTAEMWTHGLQSTMPYQNRRRPRCLKKYSRKPTSQPRRSLVQLVQRQPQLRARN